METLLNPENEVAEEYGKLSKIQKLAGLLLMLSPENAANLMKSLGEAELEEVTTEMSKMSMVSQSIQAELLREFSEVAVDAATSISGGLDRAKGLLEKSVGAYRASDIVGRVSPHREPVEAMQQIVEMEAGHIFGLIRNEQLQIIALVISYLNQSKASQVLTMLRPELRDQIVERLAMMKPTSVQVVEQVADALQSRLPANRSQSYNQTGGVRVAAEILNNMPQNVSKAILNSLTERNSSLGEAIYEKMFTFDELERLDTRTVQVVMQSVDMHLLAVSLKTAGEGVKKTLIGALSKRAADTLKEEISFMGPLKLSEIEAARRQILDTVRQLEANGEISLDELRQKSRN